VSASFFTTGDGTWFDPTDHCRGPWDEGSCHAGPPTGLLARALEQLLPGQRLTRITVDLTRPIPMAGFRIDAEVLRQGRSVSTSRATLIDRDGRPRVTAAGLHLRTGPGSPVAHPPASIPRLDEAEPGGFPITRSLHDRPGFKDAVETRYPPGQTPGPGPTTVWLRAMPLLADEEPSPFQRICPLADCGNALSRNAEPWEVGFVNPDLTLVLHREPDGDWLGSSSASHWQADGTGLADALLFDRHGVVGRALQTLLITPPPDAPRA
jgi:hypothetical protein